MRRIILACSLVGIFAVPAIAQEGPKRTPLGTLDAPPGYQTIMALTEVPPNVPNICVGRHTHFGSETAYIISGELILKIDGQPDKRVTGGEAYQIPAGVVHDGCTTNSSLKGIIVYVIEKGKPTVSPVP